MLRIEKLYDSEYSHILVIIWYYKKKHQDEFYLTEEEIKSNHTCLGLYTGAL